MSEAQDAPHSGGQGRSSETRRTLVIAAAILIAGAMTAGAILYVSLQGRPEVITTTSAQEAWEYASAGWRCEVPTEGGYKPIALDVLEIFARVENEVGRDVYDSEPARCTEPSP